MSALVTYNKTMKLFVFFIFISVWGGQSFAAPMQIGRIRYQITDEKNLPQILRKFLKSGSRLKSDGPVFKINKERNSHIDDWNDLDEGAEIDLYLPKGMVSAKKFKAYLALKKRRLEESKRKAPSPWNTSVFYMASYGRFTQTQREINISFQQNSPLSLGVSTGYRLGDNYSLSASLYASYLTSASNGLGGSDVAVRPEIGGNGYLSRKFGDNWSFFTGVDFERFTTFNINSIRLTSEIFLDENRMSFATFGIDKVIQTKKTSLLLRFSISPVINSQRLSYTTAEEFEEVFSGIKYLIYINASINKKYYFHVLYKQHSMTGPGDLNVSRIGLGIGYNL